MAKNNNQDIFLVKRERSANFTIEERDILITLIIKYKEVLENKQSDSTTWKKKEAAWANIEKEFNARSGGHPRSNKTLRIKYEGLKRTVRKKSAALRSELYRTGGGSNVAVPLDATEEKIKSLITLSAEGMASNFDSDALPQSQNSHDGLGDMIMEEFMVIPKNLKQIKPTINESCSILEEADESKEADMEIWPSTSVFEEVLLPAVEAQPMPSTSHQNVDKASSSVVNDNYGDTTPKTKKYINSTPFLKWDVSSRRNLKSRKHLALQGTSIINNVDGLTKLKMELVEVQIKLAQAELEAKRKATALQEVQHEWLAEEHKLKMLILKKQLDG